MSFPDGLKTAKVIPLFKSEDELCFNNYRPISLLLAISKVFEKAIFKQLYEHFNTHKLLYCNQLGFREEHSSEEASLVLTESIIII